MSTSNSNLQRKGGRPTKSNVRWGYDLTPIKKIALVILGTVFLYSFWLLLNGKQVEKIEPVHGEKFKITKQDSEAENEIKALEGILRDVQARNRGQSQDIYMWNENGKIRASNVDRPVDDDNYKVIEGVATSGRETPYMQKGGSILLPVIIGNNGKSYKVNMLLDTGCTVTLLDAEISAALNFQPTGKLVASIADGSQRINNTGRMDYIQVGPFKENNFFLSTAFIHGKQKTNYGLLGMNFLEKHPFTIDHGRKVIVWQ